MADAAPTFQIKNQLPDLPRSFLILEEAVLHWLSTYAAWDQRKHPIILQFLFDMRQYVQEVCHGSGSAGTIVELELDRLSKKVRDPNIDACILELRSDIGRMVAKRLSSGSAEP